MMEGTYRDWHDHGDYAKDRFALVNASVDANGLHLALVSGTMQFNHMDIMLEEDATYALFQLLEKRYRRAK